MGMSGATNVLHCTTRGGLRDPSTPSSGKDASHLQFPEDVAIYFQWALITAKVLCYMFNSPATAQYYLCFDHIHCYILYPMN
jgi:hypothetical protein